MKLACLINPACYVFYIKQFWLLLKYHGRFSLQGFRLSYDPGVGILVDKGSELHFGKNTRLRRGVDIEARDGAVVKIGDRFFMNKNSTLVARYGIQIGENCMIGEGTTIIDHNHAFYNPGIDMQSQGYKGSEVIIGNNVWIAGRVYIGQGVRIGDNVVIGANTVVTKSIPSNSIVYGKVELIIKPLKGDCTL